jgi:uncharacterized protein
MADASAFLGRGWSFPPEFSAGGAQVVMVEGDDDIQQSLEILLATRRGERVMVPDFGCDLNEFLFAEITPSLVGQVRDLVADAILNHEPRVVLNEVDISDEQAGEGLLTITIDYTVRATNSRFNLVYPFYLREASGGAGPQ